MRFIKFIGEVVIIALMSSVIFPYEAIKKTFDTAEEFHNKYKRAYNKFIKGV